MIKDPLKVDGDTFCNEEREDDGKRDTKDKKKGKTPLHGLIHD